jgi:hypothetical protein
MKSKKKQVSTWLICVLAISFFIYSSVDQVISVDDISVSGWNKKVESINKKSKKNSRSIASVKTKRKLDPRIKVISTFNNPERENDRKVNSVSLISLAPGQKIEPDFGSGGVGYRFKDHFYAIKDTPENRNDYPNHTLKQTYLIVESESHIYNSLSVVVNSQTGNEGIFTGILKIKLTDIKYINDIINHSNYQITQSYDHINVAHYLIEDVNLAVKTQKLLLAHPYVKRVSLEILEYARSHR